MGTRADFYIGRGKEAVWLGSVAWDGYPAGIGKHLLGSKTEDEFRERFIEFITNREDATIPEHGWPWPWEDSRTTDYAYAFDGGKVYGSCFGSDWFDASKEEPEEHPDRKSAVFPDMTHLKKFTLGKRSGVIRFGG